MEVLAGYLVLFLVGCLAGTINVIAGGGSFLTLPILIFMGFPAILANGTNRVGIVCQNLGAVWSFHRYKLFHSRSLLWAALPAAIGSIIGVWIAFSVGEQAFKNILAFLMIAITLWSLWNQALRPNHPSSPEDYPARSPFLLVGFLLVGIYGGFVQAGVGFIVLALTTYAGFDLVRGNAVKVLIILILTIVSLLLFAWQGKVEWMTGLILGAGTLLGGQLGVRLTILKGHKWVRIFVTVTVVLFAAKLWFAG